MIATLFGVFDGYFWHPLRNGPGYNTWSGWLSDLGLVTIFSGLAFFIAAWWRKHNCHVHDCWRLQWHIHPGHGHPVCAKHHPYGQGRGEHLRPEHHRDHSGWPGLIVHPYATAEKTVSAVGPYGSVTATVSSNLGDFDPVVGAPMPAEEPRPRKARERKPGTPDVTEIASKKKPE